MKTKTALFAAVFALLACKDEAPLKGADEAAPGEGLEIRVGKGYTTEDFREAGREYAMAVQAALGKTLQEKIKEEGTLGAIEFCNLNALAITDSLSRELGATISRITDRPRNPKNLASDQELKYIAAYKEDLADGFTAEGLVALQDNTLHFYYPIVTNDLCLQCHGTPDSGIAPEVYSKIREHYPRDRAVGYAAGELRGLWKVAFPEDKP